MLNRFQVAGLSIVALLVAAPEVCQAADPLLNQTRWETNYTTAGGDTINAIVRLNGNHGRYKTNFGTGTLKQVRVENDTINAGPLPGSGSTQTKFVKGLWYFGNQCGWFKWEMYADGSGKFVGEWGYLSGNNAGPVVGRWDGQLDGPVMGGGPVTPGGYIPIP